MKIRRIEFIVMFAVVLALNMLFSLWFLSSNTPGTAWASRLNQTVDAAAANIAQTFSYQGTLRLANGNLANGNFKIRLRLYDVPIAGDPLHDESFDSVVVRDGLFTVVVGDDPKKEIGDTVFTKAQLYLGITVNNDSELTPRQRIHPVPWAMQASTALKSVTADNLEKGGGVPGVVTFGKGGAKEIAFADGGKITDSGTGLSISSKAITIDGPLTVNGNWNTTAIRDIGDSKGGANQKANYEVSLRRYVVEATDAVGNFHGVQLDNDLLLQLCADQDGCSFRLGFRNAVEWQNRVILNGPWHLTIGQPTEGKHHWTVINDLNNPGIATNGIDGSNDGLGDLLKSLYDCTFADGKWENGVYKGDTELGFALVNGNTVGWTTIHHVCVLVIED
jgi:hypothetical protein